MQNHGRLDDAGALEALWSRMPPPSEDEREFQFNPVLAVMACATFGRPGAELLPQLPP